MTVRKHKLELPDGGLKIAAAVRKTAAADHQIPEVRIVALADVNIAPVHLRHRHGGKRQHPVDKVFQHSRHPVAVERKAEEQQIACKHPLEKPAHIVVDDAAPSVSLAGEAAAAEFDVPVDHVDDLDLLRRGLIHALQKCAGDVHGIAALPLWAAVKNKYSHMRRPSAQ